MKFLKKFEWINSLVVPKYKTGDTVLTIDGILMRIVHVMGVGMYKAAFVNEKEGGKIVLLLYDNNIDHKLEPHEIEALKYNL